MGANIPLSYNEIDIAALSRVLETYKGAHHNQIIIDFEKKISAETGAKYVVALNSGTAALHLALKGLDVKPGDEIIVSTFTYVASVNPILYVGGTPIFVDSESVSWNMDPVLLRSAIEDRIKHNRKPKAILLVYTYGMPAMMNEILEIASHFEIPILEDATEALHSTYQGQHVGTFGKIGTLSFNNNKIVTTYGGGALLTDEPGIAEKALFWATQARDDFRYYHHSEVGYNYRMGALNAAAGLYNIETLRQRVEARRRIYQKYLSKLLEYCESVQQEPEGAQSNRWLSAFELKKQFAEALKNSALSDHLSIETRPLWNPMHLQPVFRKYQIVRNGVSERLFNQGICLPSNHNLTDQELTKITDSLHQMFKK